MSDHRVVRIALLASALAMSACEAPPTSPPPVRIASLAVTGRDLYFGFGIDQANFVATVTMSNGASVDVTTSAAWSSSDEAVASVSATEPGKVIERSMGTTTIYASYQGLRDSRPTVVRCGVYLSVGPSSTLTMRPGEFRTLTSSVNQYLPMEHLQLANWSSSNSDVVTFERMPSTPYYGLEARALRPGASTLTARFGCAVETVLATVVAAP